MKRTLLMERVMDQTRLAVVEEGKLCELHIQRPGLENLTGNIYLGRVENALPGMNAAFVDIGLDKNGFLAAGDIGVDVRGDAKLAEELRERRIETLARPGQALPVQVVKAQPGAKGPRLSCHITLPGRLMVLLAGVDYVGVSRRIADPRERERLKGLGLELSSDTGSGMILRTAAQGAPREALAAEHGRLLEAYRDICQRASHAIAPRLLHDDNDLALRAVRDMLNAEVEAVWADGEACYRALSEHASALAPELSDRVRLHEGATPLFDLYRVDAQADKALERYVWLKSGGSLVIEETEALTVVDVNTGKNVGKRAPEETLFKNNCEAAEELMRQMRLRDIGGIVVVDFIDMARKAHRESLLALMRELAARDANRVAIVDITPLGLVELTRKKARQSLSRQMTHTCAHCGGNGAVPSHETTARRALRDLWRRRRGGDLAPLCVEAEPHVCSWLKKLGAPEGGEVWVAERENMEAGEYRIAPAGAPEPGRKLLKRGSNS